MTRAFPILFVTAVGALVPLVACRDTPREVTSDASAAVASSSASASASASSSASANGPANGTPIPSASVAAAVNPQNLPAYDGPRGSVEGTITLEGDHAPDVAGLDFKKCPDGVKTYGKLFREGTPLAGGARPLVDALVGVTDFGRGFYVPETKDVVRVTIEGCEFNPRTIAMTFGQRIEIVNKTKLIVRPQLDRAPTPALLIVPPLEAGDPVKIYPPRPGYFTLEDQIDLPWLKADVYVLMHPFHTATDGGGHYRIDGVPAGKAKVFTRLRAIGRETAKDVDVPAGGVAKIDLVLKYEKRDAGAPADGGARTKLIP